MCGAGARSRDAAVPDVAADDEPAAVERAELFDERHRVEETLRRMRVPTVASVEDRGAEMACERVRKAAFGVPYDERVRPDRLDRAHRVFERLAFAERRALGVEIVPC